MTNHELSKRLNAFLLAFAKRDKLILENFVEINGATIFDFEVARTLVDCVSIALYGTLLSCKLEFFNHVLITWVQVLYALLHKGVGHEVGLLMHHEFYSLARRELSLKYVLRYHEEVKSMQGIFYELINQSFVNIVGWPNFGALVLSLTLVFLDQEVYHYQPWVFWKMDKFIS